MKAIFFFCFFAPAHLIKETVQSLWWDCSTELIILFTRAVADNLTNIDVKQINKALCLLSSGCKTLLKSDQTFLQNYDFSITNNFDNATNK